MTFSLSLFFIFLMGIANFAAHRAMIESPNPVVQAAIAPLRGRFGQQATYVLEFFVLLGVMAFEHRHPLVTLILYGLYTMFNMLTYFWFHHQD